MPTPKPPTPAPVVDFKAKITGIVDKYKATVSETIRNKWAWAIRDSLANWSTDKKLREDVRTKTANVLTQQEKQQVADMSKAVKEAVDLEISAGKTYKDVYGIVEQVIKINDWTPPPPNVNKSYGEPATDKVNAPETDEPTTDNTIPEPTPPLPVPSLAEVPTPPPKTYQVQQCYWERDRLGRRVQRCKTVTMTEDEYKAYQAQQKP